MDYAEQLRIEAGGAHAKFHEYVLLVAGLPADFIFLFFEGEDDPMFYNNFVLARLAGRGYREFVCFGRSEVLKVHEMVARDGRANGRAIFFIDKDHTDIVGPFLDPLPSVYQTDTYSFENYLVTAEVLRRFWVERLRLSIADPRFGSWMKKFELLHTKYMTRCRLLMAIVLFGRGIEGEPVKLNLNNANLKNIFRIVSADGNESVRWKVGAKQKFMSSVNLGSKEIGNSVIKNLCRNHLSADPKTYVRGKYEVWFFVKFLQEMSRAVSDKALCAASGTRKAKPVETVSESNFIGLVAPLAPCPASLTLFLDEVLPLKRVA